jgi:site-specific DNA-cytosine methylase
LENTDGLGGREMKVLDLFSGLGGWSQAFKDRQHSVVTYDLNKRFHPDVCVDIMELTTLPECDVILASPPCEKFSVASIGRYWSNGISPEAKEALRLVEHTLSLIYWARPKFWFLENPTGMLRTIIGNPPVQVYFAQYGENRLKPTDIWGRHPKGFKEMQVVDRSLLDYEKAPRGSKLGTQGLKNSAERAKIPYQLSLEVCKLCEKNLH